jgi:cytochrome c peroxidase
MCNKTLKPQFIAACYVALLTLLLPNLASAVTFTASKDTTIYDNGNVNGTGGGLFAGTNGVDVNQRGLIAFDLSSIPSGSTITNVSVDLHVNVAALNSGAISITLNALTQDWNEASTGTGGETSGGGNGVVSSDPNDATWTSSGITAWTAGGAFNPVESSSLVISSVGTFNTFTGPGLITDVQTWVDNPGTNYGWIIRGLENSNSSSKRFSSRENTGSSGANVPFITIEYDAPPATGLLPVPVPAENPITEDKRILGKILFWDEQLSSNDTVACGSCHIPSAGGADPRAGAHPGADGLFSTADDVIGSPGIVNLSSSLTPVNDPVFGFDTQVTSRAAPTAIGAMYTPDHFWDGRATSQFVDPEDGVTVIIASGGALESQAVVPILSTVEMAHTGRTWADVKTKLQGATPLALASNIPADLSAALAGNPDYPTLFAAAFGDNAITAARIGMAIATYERTLLPDQSPWDLYIAGDSNAMSAQQLAGWNFLETSNGGQRCLSCHTPPTFSDNAFHNIGLRPSAEDLGRENITGNTDDRGRFKTPTLRNSGLRKQLMHVGWITDNSDAIDFYNAGTADVTSNHSQFTTDQSPLPGSGNDYTTAQLTPTDEANQNDVAEFLANGLTDPRVANETFPFDRPTLRSEFSTPAINDQLKLMSYNIDSATWDSAQADRIEAVIDAEAADVIGLQEVSAIPLADLIARVGDDYDFIATSGSDNNNPILVRKNIFNIIASGSTVEDAMLLCTTKSYVNYVVLTQISTNAQFTFHNTKLCPLATASGDLEAGVTAEQTNQAHAIDLVTLINQNLTTYGAATFTAGAYNAPVGSATMDFLIEQTDLPGPVSNPVTLDDSYDTATGNNNPGTDVILFRTNFVTISSADIVNNPTTLSASSHLPVVTVVEVADSNDQDGDTILDTNDNCPTIANLDQLNTDGDAQGNVCDADDDNDGLSDVFETSIGTNTLLTDTDLDGLTDFEEVNVDGDANSYTVGLDTNPLDADTDNDGLSDGEEDLNGNGVFDANEPSPFLIDTDDDGLTDRYEVNTSTTDPTSPTTLTNGTPGDMNGDGNINAGDIILLNRQVLGL